MAPDAAGEEEEAEHDQRGQESELDDDEETHALVAPRGEREGERDEDERGCGAEDPLHDD